MLSTVPSAPLSETDVLAALAPDGGRHEQVGEVTDTAVRIMLAAADAFAEHGFPATTTRDIASRAGLSPAGVYVHFASKEVLLFELSRRGHARARDLLVDAADAASTPTEALRSIVGGFSRWHAEHHQLGRIVQFEFRHLSPEHRDVVLALRKEIDQVVAGVLRDGVESGEFAVDYRSEAFRRPYRDALGPGVTFGFTQGMANCPPGPTTYRPPLLPGLMALLYGDDIAGRAFHRVRLLHLAAAAATLAVAGWLCRVEAGAVASLIGLGLVTAWSVISNSTAFGDASIPFDVPWPWVGILLVVPMVGALLATLAPATSASRVRPAVALRIAD